MKRILLVLSAALFVVNISAQGFSGGLFFGPTTSWIATDSRTVNPEKVKLGYTFGATADIRVFDNFALSTGIRFNNIGGSMSFPFGAYDVKAMEVVLPDTLIPGSSMNFNLNYISVPFGFKGKTNEIGYITYFLKGGATPMVNIKAKGDVGSMSDLVINDHVKLFNIGWHIGGGIEYGLSGSTRLLVEVIYTGGLFDFSSLNVFLSPPPDSPTEDPRDFINPKTVLNDIHLKVGILF